MAKHSERLGVFGMDAGSRPQDRTDKPKISIDQDQSKAATSGQSLSFEIQMEDQAFER